MTVFCSFAGVLLVDACSSAQGDLYTNQIQPYYRAPHIFMGFPMRYTDRGWSESMMCLPGLEERLARSASSPRYGTAVTDGLFMTSRDGVLFHRWNEAFLTTERFPTSCCIGIALLVFSGGDGRRDMLSPSVGTTTQRWPALRVAKCVFAKRSTTKARLL